MSTENFKVNLHGSQKNKVLRILLNSDLRSGHDGLTKAAKEFKVDTEALQVGEFIIFVNTKKSAVKIFAANQTIAYFRMPGHRQMNVKTLALIPMFFNGTEFQYDKALTEVLRREWGDL